jgi:hypothetical protein
MMKSLCRSVRALLAGALADPFTRSTKTTVDKARGKRRSTLNIDQDM